MRAFPLIVFLLMPPVSSAQFDPDWARFGVGETESFILSVDLRSIQIDGGLGRAMVLENLKQQDKDGTVSIRRQWELDCAKGRYRSLAFWRHGLNGLLSTGYAPGEWGDASSNKVIGEAFRGICTFNKSVTRMGPWNPPAK